MTTRYCFRMGLLTAIVLAVWPTGISRAQPADRSRMKPFGLEGLRILFQQKSLRNLDTSWDVPERELVMVVLGDVDNADSIYPYLEEFVRKGGALLVASDQGSSLLNRFMGVRLRRGPISLPGNGYLGHDDCFATTNLQSSHPVFQGVTRLVLNRPGCISEHSGRWTPLAWLPEGARRDGSELPVRTMMVTRETRSGGSALIIADHSLFINEMLLHGDNAIFAWNVVNWLCRSGDRKYLAFIQDGFARSKLPITPPPDYKPPTPPIPEMPDQIPDIPDESVFVFANSFLSGLEDNNVYNRFLSGQPRGVRAHAFRRFVVLVLSGVVVSLFMLWMILARSRRFPGLEVPEESFSERRHLEMIEGGYLKDPARVVARGFLEQSRGDLVESWNDLPMPRVSSEGAFWQRWRNASDVRRLLKIARSGNGTKMKQKQLVDLIRRVERLEGLRNEGLLRLEWEPIYQ